MDWPVWSVVPELDKERSGNTSKKFTVFLKSLEAVCMDFIQLCSLSSNRQP